MVKRKISKKKKTEKVSRKSVTPREVKIISILYYIVASAWILQGGLLILAHLSKMPALKVLLTIVGGVNPILVGVAAIVMGIVLLFVARGLWKHMKMARLIAILFAIFSIVDRVFSLVSARDFILIVQLLIPLIINALIARYLIKNKEGWI